MSDRRSKAAQPASLRRTIGSAGFFALAFGSIVGSGWVLVLGEWLGAAGPGGAVLGFIGGGLLMTLVAAAYGELGSRFPRSGGELVYVLEGLGRGPAFIVGWFLTLYLVCFTAFEGIALAWFLETLIPVLKGAPLYTLLGHELRAPALAIGILGAAFFTWLNAAGSAHAMLFQRIVTFTFIGVAAALILLGFALGDLRNLEPLLDAPGQPSWITGSLWVFATSAVFLNGFQGAIYAIEERAETTSLRAAIFPMIAAVGAAAAFYCLIILSASSSAPWRSLLESELPVAAAYDHLLGNRVLGTIVLVAAAISLLKTWNALHLSAARMILAQARAGLLPVRLASIDPVAGAPRNAILFVGACTSAGVLLGRGAIVPIINMSAICITLAFVLCLCVLLKLRRSDEHAPAYRVPGGTPVILLAICGTMIAAGVAFIDPLLNAGRLPLEWILLAAWGLLGGGLLVLRRRSWNESPPHAA